MSKATPIPDSIERRPGGIEYGSCLKCGGRLTRVGELGERLELGQYPWWHVETGRVLCMEKDGNG